MFAFGAGRGGRGAADEDDGSNAAMTDQDDDDDHVKLLNPVKVLGTQAHHASDTCLFIIAVLAHRKCPRPQAAPLTLC